MKNTTFFSLAMFILVLMLFSATGCESGSKKNTDVPANSQGVTLKDLPEDTLAVTRNCDYMANLTKNLSTLLQWMIMTQKPSNGATTTIFYEYPPADREDRTSKLIYFTGIPVVKGTTGSKPAIIYTFDATKAACIYHRGPYSSIGKTYDKLIDWMRANNYVPTGKYREIYHSGPGPRDPGDPSKWITEIQAPVEKAR